MLRGFIVRCSRVHLALSLGFLAVLLWTHPAWAATRTVDTLTDNASLTTCSAAPDDCSLRGALSGASANDTIDFDPSLANQTITLALGQLAINQPVTLDGSTALSVTVSGNDASRVITTTQPLTVTSLIIQNGVASFGGGIYAGSDLRLINSLIRNNVATASYPIGSGGGAYVSGAISITGTSFLSNRANVFGGGAFVGGAASITGTSFLSNTANSQGGAVYVGGTASVKETSFLNNTAGNSGGGAYVNGGATITGASFSSNTSSLSGGGAYVDGAATITGTSFLSNTANSHGGGVYVGRTASISGTSFLTNTSHVFGGGAYVFGAASITGTSFL